MSKKKKWIFSGVILLSVGILIAGIAFAIAGADMSKLNSLKLVQNAYEISDDFDNINIEADIENINFALSDDKSCKVLCYEEEDYTHNVSVQNNTLMITKPDRNKWYLNYYFVTETPEITVYLPENYYKSLKIDSDTGDNYIPNEFSFDSISVSLSTGNVTCLASANKNIDIETDTGNISLSDMNSENVKIISDTGEIEINNANLSGKLYIEEDTGSVKMQNISCNELAWNANTGEIAMTDVIAANDFKLESDTGDIEFNSCDAETIFAESSTGNIYGTLLKEMVIIAESDTGDINIPKTFSGGRCELITDTGDITIELK